MKLKSAAGYSCLVSDLDKTTAFYENLGLEVKKRSASRLIIYLNWYRIDFFLAENVGRSLYQQSETASDKGAGLFLYFSVDDVDQAYKEIVDLELEPLSEPTDQPWGNREFVIADPDGYKIAIFKRKVAANPLD